MSSRTSRRPVGLALAAACLSAIGCGPGRVEQLVGDLRSETIAVRRTAARSLMELGREASVAVEPLIAALGDADLEVRKLSARALGAIGPQAAPAIPTLEKQLQSSDWGMRLTSAYAIQKINPTSKLYQPELIAAINKGEGGVIVAVGALQPPADWAVQALVELLHDNRPGTRRIAIESIGQIEARRPVNGERSADVETALREALSDPDDRVRESAQKALDALKK